MIRNLLSKFTWTDQTTVPGDDIDLERTVNSSHYGARPTAHASEASRDEDLLSWAKGGPSDDG